MLLYLQEKFCALFKNRKGEVVLNEEQNLIEAEDRQATENTQAATDGAANEAEASQNPETAAPDGAAAQEPKVTAAPDSSASSLPVKSRTHWLDQPKWQRILLLSFGGLALALILSLLFVPYAKYALFSNPAEVLKLAPSQALFGDSEFIVSTVFMLCVLGYFSTALIVFGLGLRFLSNLERLAKTVNRTAILAVVGAGVYYVGGVIYAMICNMLSGTRADYMAGSPIPYFISIVLLLCVVFFGRQLLREKEPLPVLDKKVRFCRTEMMIYSALALVCGVLSALGDILRVEFIKPASVDDLVFNGLDSLMGKASVPEAFGVASFFVFMIVLLSAALFVLLLGAYIFRSRIFYRLALGGMGLGVVCSFLTGSFGKYYEISQDLNEEMIREWISGFASLNAGGLFEIDVESDALLFFVLALAVLVLAFIRRPYSRGISDEEASRIVVAATVADTHIAASQTPAPVSNGGLTPAPVGGMAPAPTESAAPAPVSYLPAQEQEDTEKEFSFSTEDVNVEANIVTTPGGVVKEPETETRPVPMADPCPAFSELDEKAVALGEEIAALAAGERPITLPELVQFIVDYARESRLHLSYTPEDIATFLAGLGASRLTILQGMSGTGKTSLPKIFTEAIFGACDIVEVESSWRDKNELLGYYNEFSRTYTPRKFTQALYRAALHPERLTLIVLDEMNLSRVEYYFSDFLSLMENEEDKREIKLLSVGLYRVENGERIPYEGLTDGHTIRIPRNIWFIGTANRDESTFEISDKVYDRAHTMNFNKRAPKAIPNGEPLDRRFISADLLLSLLEEARQTPAIDIDNDPTIKAVEELLSPYNISFGNRIANQIESFVSVYCACFPKSKQAKAEALERILLSKVVTKLEFKSVENKELLAAEFARRGLQRCAEFIRRLSED